MIRSTTLKSCTSIFSNRLNQSSLLLFKNSNTSIRFSSTLNNNNDNDQQLKYYSLSQFPYPSGNLHMGHVRVYTMSDCVARLKRMQGYQVVHPMGWDAFGLPAENAAIDKQVSPALWTNQNIQQMTTQLKRLDLQFDWERELSTCSPDYYRWTQDIFLRLYSKGLAYRKHSPVNWDPVDQTVLANEQVDSQGRSWRSNALVERREMKQWYFKITEYADRLADDLDKLTGWPEDVKTMQREWIGRSVGALVDFTFGGDMTLTAFTTRPETLFGVTFLSVHYKHPILEKILEQTTGNSKMLIDKQKREQLQSVIEKIKQQQESAVPTSADKEPELIAIDTGVQIDTPTGGKVTLVVASTVLPDYGTGVVMGVPGHNPVDHNIAKLLNIPIRHVITRADNNNNNNNNTDNNDNSSPSPSDDLYDNKDGTLINSGSFNSLSIKDAIAKMISESIIKPSKSYRIRDWLLSRQRYWGTPIPIIHCDSCGEVPVPRDQLPVKLPTDIEFTGKGNLLNSLSDWKNCKCPKCGGSAQRETDTMDTFVDSSWYYLRFLDSKNQKEMFNKDIVNKLMPVDVYVGGIEHAILHLLYSRFFTKFLKDQGIIDHDEPFKVLLTQGLVKSPTYRDSTTGKPLYPKDVDFTTPKPINKLTGNLVNITLEKMSKSKLNGVDPNEMIDKYGSDTLKLYILFKAPPENSLEWDTDGIEGCRKWLKRVESLVSGYVAERNNGQISKVSDKWNTQLNSLRYDTHSSIEKVTESIDRYTFNTAISFLMTLSNQIGKYQNNVDDKSSREYLEALETLVVLLAPFAPNASQQLWTELKSIDNNNNNNNNTVVKIQKQRWPVASKECLALQQKTLVIQFNGKVKSVINVQSDQQQQSELETLAKEHMKDKMSKFEISKTFFSTTKAGYSINFILIPKK
ncbi:leucyl-tRNA synthetase [Heterostelium album PN500]|uniref:leucine--tRNA ligase n=1 Tax=Heterostelium pallidum (strain ATCC 26659 / Pp 5 / PN500) TaxID=670386 RepID=D3BE62_HETP5|nr:leucyl-tRNA synthetase [Heterostelium album PN500]EFA80193.1 leucyl-tRNA synthetase [Heterostelium album PN500]|eukprot:XP_020432313.1 leucyl-tRNA synthetase [Heterostelium album PN500]